MTKKIIIVNGAPGSGKTTLVKYLKKYLDVVFIEKDAIKEFYFEYVGHGDREMSRLIGKASIDSMFALARQMIHIRDGLLLETAFYAELAKGDFDRLVEGYDAEFLELYCHVDESVRARRFEERAKADRHPGHADLVSPDEAKNNLDRYVPLGIGEVVAIDTGSFNIDKEGVDIIEKINSFITEEADNETTN